MCKTHSKVTHIKQQKYFHHLKGCGHNKKSVLFPGRLRWWKYFCCFICVTLLWALHIVIKQQFFLHLSSLNDDRKSTVQLAIERSQRWCIPDRRWQAVPRWCRSHWEGTVTERWTSSGRYHQHGCVSKTQTASTDNVRCPDKASSEVFRRCSTKAAVGQNAQPECNSLQNSQPVELTK